MICDTYIAKYSEELKRTVTEPVPTERYISYKIKYKLPSEHILFIAYADYVFQRPRHVSVLQDHHQGLYLITIKENFTVHI
jgi:hypothetical protein